MQTCPSCGHEQSPAARCEACGEWLGEPEAPAPPQPLNPVEPESTGYDEAWHDPEPEPEPHPFYEPEPEPEDFTEPEPVGHEFHEPEPAHDEPVFDVAEGAAGAAPVAVGRRRGPGMSSAVTFALLGGAFAMGLLIVIIIANRSAPDSNAKPTTTTPATAKTSAPPEIVKLRRAELDALRDSLADVKRDETTGPILDAIDRLNGDVRNGWSATDWPAVDNALSRLELQLKELQKIDAERKAIANARTSAERTRGFVDEARGRAEKAGAVELAPEYWKRATDADAEAREHFGTEKYAEAQAKWDRALTDYEQANALASAGVAARQTRDNAMQRSTRRFTREQLEASGGEAWKQVNEALAEGDAAYEKTHYTDAISRYEQAGDTIEAAEHNVQRELGVKFYAVNAGYLAASILLEHASGQYLDDSGHRSLVSAYRDLGLDTTALSKVPEADGDKLPYRTLGNALAILMRDAIKAARGEPAQRAYNIGFQLRIIQKLLGDEQGDPVTAANKAEVGKSLALLKREIEEAGFADNLADELDRVRQTLTEAGDSGIGQARRDWLALIGRLSRYESAIKIVGEASATAGAAANE